MMSYGGSATHFIEGSAPHTLTAAQAQNRLHLIISLDDSLIIFEIRLVAFLKKSQQPIS